MIGRTDILRFVRLGIALVAASAVIIPATADTADAFQFGRRFHQWGRFRPGSWVVVRQGIETIGERGQIVGKSTSETRMTLAVATEKDLTLQVQSSLEVGDRKLENPPQQLRQGLLGERPDAAAALVDLPQEDVFIQGRAYRCDVTQAETVGLDGRKQVIKSWIAPQIAPYVLRKVTTVLDPATNQVVSETVMEVVSLSSQRRILARTRTVAEVQTVQRHSRGQTMTHAFCCPEIPGGVVSQTSQEYDAQGQLLRRTQMELVDFETK